MASSFVDSYNDKKNEAISLIDAVLLHLQSYLDDIHVNTLSTSESIDNQDASDDNSISSFSIKNLKTLRKKIDDDTVKILITGAFSSGKSTILNAFLGQKVLPAYSRPCTAVITEIKWGEEKKATISFNENLEKIPSDTPPAAADYIRKYMPNVPDLVLTPETEDFGKTLEKYIVAGDSSGEEEPVKNPFKNCILEWPLELCGKGVEIIDSPGINACYGHDMITFEYAPTADVIVHVLNAMQCWTKTDEQFIKKFLTFSKAPVLFAVNRFDQLDDDDDKHQLLEKRPRSFEKYAWKGKEGIFFTSAKKALDAQIKKDTAAFAESGILNMEETIGKILNEQKAGIKLFNNINLLSDSLKSFMDGELANTISMLSNDTDQLKSQIENAKAEIADLKQTKDRIISKICVEEEQLERFFKNESQTLINTFSNDEFIKNAVETVNFEIRTFHPKDDATAAVYLLKDAFINNLKSELDHWAKTTLTPKLQRQIKDIIDDIRWDLRQFKEKVSHIKMTLDPSNAIKGPESISSDLGIDVVIGDVIEQVVSAAAGGAIATAALFILERFIVVLGPIGWIISIVAGIVTAWISVIGLGETIEDKIRKKFVETLGEQLREKSSNISEELSKEFAANARSEFNKIKSSLTDAFNALCIPLETTKNAVLNGAKGKERLKQAVEQHKQELTVLHDKVVALASKLKA